MLLRKLFLSLIRLRSKLTSIFSWWKRFGYRPGLIFFCFIVSIFADNYTSTKRCVTVTVNALNESRVQSLICLRSKLTSIFSWWKRFGYRPGLIFFFCFIVSFFADNHSSTKRGVTVTVNVLNESRVIT